MERHKRRPAASAKARGSKNEQLGSRLDLGDTDLRCGPQAISTPREAIEAMVLAGAVFATHHSAHSLGVRFTFEVAPDGDRERCREILADAKRRPAQFFAAFRVLVADLVRGGA